MWTSHPPPVRVVFEDEPLSVGADAVDRVDRAWEAARQRTPGLFNGTLLSVWEHRDNALVVRPCEYRLYAAQKRDPSLARVLGVQPLAVTGVTRVDDGIALARRGQDVSEGKRLWELLPAGGLEMDDVTAGRVDPERRLLAELFEEAKVEAGEVTGMCARTLVFDDTVALFDLVYEIDVRLDEAAFRRRFESRYTQEYAELRIVPRSAIRRWADRTDVLPLTRYLIESLHLSKPS